MNITTKHLTSFFLAGFMILSLGFTQVLQADETYYKFWVQLEDKEGTPFSVDKPEEFLSAKAIARRKKHNIKITESDLPVNPSYVEKIAAKSNVKVLYTSKWLNAVAIQTKNEYDVDVVEDLDFVKLIKPLGKWTIEDEDEDEKEEAEYDDFKTYAGKKDEQTKGVRPSVSDLLERGYGNAYYQTRMLNLIKMHDLGYTGKGVTIAVIDAGFRNYYRHRALDSLRNSGRLLGYYNIAYGDSIDNDNGEHGLNVLSCMAANIPNTMIGTAPHASYLLISSEDEHSEFPVEEANWVRAAEYADSCGVDVITSSLGYKGFDDEDLSHTYKDINGKTSVASQAATMASEKGIVVLVAAGNDGTQKKNYISCPGDAEGIITVGGVDYDREHTSFSSYGPTYDKRIKPDVCAKASYVYLAKDDNSFGRSNGTSFSTPIMAGAVACLIQANPDKSVEEIMEALKKSADHHFDPNNTYGHGIPDIFVANSFLNKENSFFDYETERLIDPGINDFSKRIYYRFYSPKAQTVTIRITRKGVGKKKDKVVYEEQHSVAAKDFLQGEIPKVSKYKSGEYLFELINAEGTVYKRTLEK